MRRDRLVLVAVTAVVALPLVVALADAHHPRWYPVVDWAQIELRVRDVALTNPPLVGLPGRIYAYGEGGSHPGPIAFYALAPVYRLLGSTSFSLLASTMVLNVVALAIALWIGMRRGSLHGLLFVATGLAVLVHAYGTERMVVPWNPWLPLLWWVVFLLAVWSVMCDDLAMLPVAAFAGSFCVQTHVSYLGSVPGIALCAVAVVVVRSLRRPAKTHRPDVRPWVWLALGVLLVLWLPVVVDELVNEPGNLSIIVEQFTEPVQRPVGTRVAIDAWLAHLHPGSLLGGDQRVSGPIAPALVVLGCWLLSAVMAVAVRHRALLTLHAVVAMSLLFGLASMTRVLGALLGYLVLWSWGTTVLLLGATAWSVAAYLADRSSVRPTHQVQVAVLAIAAVVPGVASMSDDSRADTPFPGLSDTLDRAVPALTSAIRTGAVAPAGVNGHYSVSWEPDALFAWLVPYGLLLELERSGIRATMAPEHRSTAGRHRVAPVAGSHATLVYVTGDAEIARWRARRDAREVVHVPAPEADEVELAAARDYAISLLGALGLPEHAAMVDTNVWGLSLDARVPPTVRSRLNRMLELSSAASVFVVASR